jgi:hypothetical protein
MAAGAGFAAGLGGGGAAVAAGFGGGLGLAAAGGAAARLAGAGASGAGATLGIPAPLIAGRDFGSYFRERVLDPDAGRRDRLVEGSVVLVQRRVQILDAGELGEVALVELDDVGHVAQLHAVRLEILLEVLERLDVRAEHRFLRVGDEHDAVGALEDQLPRLVVEDLPGDRVQLDPRLHAADLSEVDRQEIEEQRAVGLGRQREHLAADLTREVLVDVLEVGGLPAEPRPVVHDLRGQLSRRVVEEHHLGPPLSRARGPCAPAAIRREHNSPARAGQETPHRLRSSDRREPEVGSR